MICDDCPFKLKCLVQFGKQEPFSDISKHEECYTIRVCRQIVENGLKQVPILDRELVLKEIKQRLGEET